MPESFDISSSTGSYSVEIQTGSVGPQLTGRQEDFIVSDAFFRDKLGSAFASPRGILFYEASEAIKSLDAVPRLIEQMRSSGVNRQTKLIAIGGGVIQDLSAFAASIYMRGVPWLYIPTTILAMVDSCIGGKSSINVGPYKNLVGTFHPPFRILIDPELASTLPLDQQASGLVEAAKICFCRGSESFVSYLACDPHPGMQTDALAALISYSLRAKKWFIEIDEFDQNERLLLNFGHTFGHAIEGASHYAIPHGLAVGIGILCALAFVREDPEQHPGAYDDVPMVRAFEAHLAALLRSVPELSRHLARLPLEEVMERFESDKKHRQDKYVLILVDHSGKVIRRDVTKSAKSVRHIRRSIESIVGKYAQ